MITMRVQDALGFFARARFYKREVGREGWELVGESHNVPLDVGKAEVAQLLAGDVTTSWKWTAVGSDGTAAKETDTELGTEVIRKEWAGYKIAGGIITSRTYFAPHEAIADLKEWGLVSAATAGVFLNRGNISPTITKKDTEELMVEVIITVG